MNKTTSQVLAVLITLESNNVVADISSLPRWHLVTLADFLQLSEDRKREYASAGLSPEIPVLICNENQFYIFDLFSPSSDPLICFVETIGLYRTLQVRTGDGTFSLNADIQEKILRFGHHQVIPNFSRVRMSKIIGPPQKIVYNYFVSPADVLFWCSFFALDQIMKDLLPIVIKYYNIVIFSPSAYPTLDESNDRLTKVTKTIVKCLSTRYPPMYFSFRPQTPPLFWFYAGNDGYPDLISDLSAIGLRSECRLMANETEVVDECLNRV